MMDIRVRIQSIANEMDYKTDPQLVAMLTKSLAELGDGASAWANGILYVYHESGDLKGIEQIECQRPIVPKDEA